MLFDLFFNWEKRSDDKKKASKTCKTLLMTMWLPWQQSICERYASLRSAVGLMLCYLMCGTFTRCNDRNSATCMIGCLFRCLQAVCIISQWCWSWYFFFVMLWVKVHVCRIQFIPNPEQHSFLSRKHRHCQVTTALRSLRKLQRLDYKILFLIILLGFRDSCP